MHIRAIMSGEANGAIPGLLRGTLSVAAAGYRWGVQRRNRRFDIGAAEVVRLARPVLSIGNITAGGTGKTPMVIWLCEYLRGQGKRPGILCRGYKGRADGDNDEVQLLRASLPDVPIVVDADRVQGGRKAITEFDCDVLVLDDGFQHRRLGRDVDIVLIDATCPFGYGHLLPRGLLREPPANLSRADIAVITRCDLVSAATLERIRKDVERWGSGDKDAAIPIVESVQEPTGLAGGDDAEFSVEELKGRKVLAVCGIGNPASFRRALESLGAVVADALEYPDHHHYQPNDVAVILAATGRPGVDFCVTTGKDWVKLKAFKEMRNIVKLRRLDVRTRITKGFALLDTAISRRLADGSSP